MTDARPPPSPPPAISAPRRLPTFDTLDDAARAYAELRDEVVEERKERAFVREQLKDIKTVLDVLLEMAKDDEEKHEAASV